MSSLEASMDLSDALEQFGFPRSTAQTLERLEIGVPLCEVCVANPIIWLEVFAACELEASTRIEIDVRRQLMKQMPEILQFCRSARAEEQDLAARYLGDSASRKAETAKVWKDSWDDEQDHQRHHAPASPSKHHNPGATVNQPVVPAKRCSRADSVVTSSPHSPYTAIGDDSIPSLERTTTYDEVPQPGPEAAERRRERSTTYDQIPQPGPEAAERRREDGTGAGSGVRQRSDSFSHRSAALRPLAEITERADGSIAFWLEKKSPGRFANWQRRWMVLEPWADGIVRYYTDPIKETLGKEKKEMERLRLSSIVRLTSNNFESAHFELHFGGGKVLELRCETKERRSLRDIEALFLLLHGEHMYLMYVLTTVYLLTYNH
eukprot:COSAG05_NODE_3557_length_1992_cov_2.217116_2_plen_378_part_00